jgi:hypothetical protein
MQFSESCQNPLWQQMVEAKHKDKNGCPSEPCLRKHPRAVRGEHNDSKSIITFCITIAATQAKADRQSKVQRTFSVS